MIHIKMTRDAIRVLLGKESTEEDVIEVHQLLQKHFPGAPLDVIPTEVWEWVRTGEGPAPWNVAHPSASATSLMGHFAALDDHDQAALLALARVAQPA
jgi:hypothetical protein